jgi:predicted AlkP superfamily pyrophosphatase or phosphodiesterase
MVSGLKIRRAISPALTLVSVSALLAASAAAHQPSVSTMTSVRSKQATRPVILISVDGLRPDAIETYQAQTMLRLMNTGTYTLNASTIMPSKTLPSHASMLTGELPAKHGVLWNNEQIFKDEELKSPTIFAVLHSKGFKTAAFFSKSKFDDFQVPGTLDYTQAPGGMLGGLILGRWDSDRTTRDVVKYLKSNRPDLLFIHYGDVDRAGHSSGWMSKKYGSAVKKVDAAIAQVLTAANETFGDYTVIVTADHGGHDKDHGSADPRDVTIPWIAWGGGIAPGRITDKVSTMDTASTVLSLFGMAEPTDWTGNPVSSALSGALTASTTD